MIQELIGKTMREIVAQSNELILTGEDGVRYRFYHDQDCCETVEINDINGDIQSLVGSPITLAEVATKKGDSDDNIDSSTWTFYRFATAKGYVDVRWFGTSNGYYSESVSMDILSPE